MEAISVEIGIFIGADGFRSLLTSEDPGFRIINRYVQTNSMARTQRVFRVCSRVDQLAMLSYPEAMNTYLRSQ
jgi:hypothetical protein